MVIGEVFATAAPGAGAVSQGTMLETLADRIAAQLAVLDDWDLTGTGQSSAEALGIPAGVLSPELTRHLLDPVVAPPGARRAADPAGSQLNDDVTHLQGQRLVRQAQGTVTNTMSGGT
jgi:hypothetical protein